jgi:hypothetical protein
MYDESYNIGLAKIQFCPSNCFTPSTGHTAERSKCIILCSLMVISKTLGPDEKRGSTMKQMYDIITSYQARNSW